MIFQAAAIDMVKGIREEFEKILRQSTVVASLLSVEFITVATIEAQEKQLQSIIVANSASLQ